ncbi:hypothetical protein BH10PSE7_BH10PSE7_28770 [soil metagenome]
MVAVDKEKLRRIVTEVRALNVPADVFWEMVEERLGTDHGDVFHFIAEDPAFYGFADDDDVPPRP